jgi:rubrerythrin
MAIGEINTASAVMGLARKLEEEGAQFYTALAERHPEQSEIFLALARENIRNITLIERTYYSVISDALEGCFSFSLFPEEYVLKVALKPQGSLSDALALAAEMEAQVIRFYTRAAEQSKSLLADLPRIFAQIAQKRESRKTNLASLASK